MISIFKLRVFLILVIFLSVFSITFYFIKNFAHKEINLKIKDVNIQWDLKLQKVHVVEKKRDRKEWELKADSTEMFNKENITILKNVRLKLYPENREEITVVGKKGNFNNNTKNMEIYGNVIVSSNDGYSLKTDSLKFISSKKVVETDDPVEISKDGINIIGKGLFSQLDKKELEIKRDVKAIFHHLN